MDIKISRYIEIQKRYREELAEVAKITPEEEKMRDLYLAEFEALKNNDISSFFTVAKKMEKEINSTEYQAQFYICSTPTYDNDSIKIISNDKFIPEFDVDVFFSSTPKITEQDIPGNIELFPPLYILYAGVIEYGCLIPFTRLLYFVLSHKKEMIELFPNFNVSEVNEEFAAIIFSDEDKDLVKDAIDDLCVDFVGERNVMNEFINPLIEGMNLMKETNLSASYKKLFEVIRVWLQDVYRYVKGEGYLVNNITDTEKKAFDSIIHQPFMEPVINKMMEAIKEEAEQNSVEDETFTLPDNYFSGISPSTNRKEYFTSTLWGDKCCVEDFVDLINYIADRGFIENNKATKQLLAFRLTGRLRPDGELPKIKWNGKAAKGADCIFLLKCTDAKPKYPKMKEFFEADFPTKYFANNASVRFMEKLHELFPEIYELPNKYK